MKSKKIFLIVVLFLASCTAPTTPTPAQIFTPAPTPTQIATEIHTVTKTATSAPVSSTGLISSPSVQTIGNILYDFPDTGTEWCLDGTYIEKDRQIQDLKSSCTVTAEVRATIELTHLNQDQSSTESAIHSYVQRLEAAGLHLDFLQFMEDLNLSSSSLSPVRMALVDMTDAQGQRVFLILAAFEADGEFYTIRGLYDGSERGLNFLADSISSLLNSMRLTQTTDSCVTDIAGVVDYLNLHGYDDMTIEKNDNSGVSSLFYDMLGGDNYGRLFSIHYVGKCVAEIRVIVTNHNPPTQTELEEYSPFMATLSTTGLTESQALLVINWLDSVNILDEAYRSGIATESLVLSPPAKFPMVELTYEVYSEMLLTKYNVVFQPDLYTGSSFATPTLALP